MNFTRIKIDFLNIVTVFIAKTFNLISDNFRFASSEAGFAMLLRNSEYKGNAIYNEVIDRRMPRWEKMRKATGRSLLSL